jgi:hypothetical protein
MTNGPTTGVFGILRNGGNGRNGHDAEVPTVPASLLEALKARQGLIVLAAFHARDALAKAIDETAFLPAVPNANGTQVEIGGDHVTVTLLLAEDKEIVTVAGIGVAEIMRFEAPGWVLNSMQLRLIRGLVVEVKKALAFPAAEVVNSAALTEVVGLPAA